MKMRMIKKHLRTLSSRQKASTSILIAVLIVASILAAYFKISMYNTKGDDLYDVGQMNELQWRHIENSLETFTAQAQKDADEAALEIKVELKKRVDSGEFAKGFTINQDNVEELSLLSSVVIEERFLNGVYNGHNSMFVATKEGVISDLSLAYSVPLGEPRTWEAEKERHYNKALADQSIDAILRQSEQTIFWEYSDLYCGRHDSIESMSMHDLKATYDREGVEGLKHYVFLVPSYIEKYGDMLKNPDTTSKGEQVDNDKIIVVQRFNLADQISNNKIKKDYLEALIAKEQNFIRENEYELKNRTAFIMIVIGAFVIFSLSLMFYINSVVSKENR